MPPRAPIPPLYGKCKRCNGIGIVFRIAIKFFPLITKCPDCEGKGGIEEIFQNGKRVRLPYPKKKLAGTLSEYRHL